MRCEDYRELLWSYAKEELAQEIRPDVQAHLGTCRECAKELMYVRKMIQIVHELPNEELPSQYHTVLVKKLKKEAKKLPKEVRKPKKEKAVKEKAVKEKAVKEKAVKEKAVKEKRTPIPIPLPQKVAVAKVVTKNVHDEESDRPEGFVAAKKRLHDEEADRLEAGNPMESRKMVHEDEEEQFDGLDKVQGIVGLEVFDGVPIAASTKGIISYDDKQEVETTETIEDENNDEDESVVAVPLVKSVDQKTAPSFKSTSQIQNKAKNIKEKEKKKAAPFSQRNLGIVAAALLLLVGGGAYQLVNSMGIVPNTLNFNKSSGVGFSGTSGISASDMAEVLSERPVANIPTDEFGNALSPDDAVMARGNFADLESNMARGGEFLDATDMNDSNATDFLGGTEADFLEALQGRASEMDSLVDQSGVAMSFPNDSSSSTDAMAVDTAMSESIAEVEAETEIEEDNSGDADSVDENIVVKVKDIDKAVASLIDITKQFLGCTVDDSKSGIVIVSLSPKDIETLVSELASVGTITNVSVLNPAINDKQTANVGVIFYT